jgi:hypothetical protein
MLENAMRKSLEEIVLERHATEARELFTPTEIALEGVATAVVADVGHKIHGFVSRVKGWLEGIQTKRKHINEILDDTIEWLKDEDRYNKNLRLDMGSFKTWMKTSETYLFRYYYLLNDSLYNEIVDDLKKGNISELESLFSHLVDQINASQTLISSDMKDRRSATRLLDSAKTIKDLIVIVSKYKSRVNLIFDLMEKQDRGIKGFPFQLMLRGAIDLRTTVKKIVNLAI